MQRRWLLVAVPVLVVVVAFALVALWRQPGYRIRDSYGIEVKRQVGQSVWTALSNADVDGPDVDIDELEPVFASDGAKVEVEYLICELDEDVLDDEGVVGFGYGASQRDVDRYCVDTRPAEGATFDQQAEPQQALIVGVTPTRRGKTVITGHRIEYGVGWEHGTDEIDVEVHVVVRR